MAWVKTRRHATKDTWGFKTYILTSNSFGTHLMGRSKPIRVVVPESIYRGMTKAQQKDLRKEAARQSSMHGWADVGIEVEWGK